jgi:hypothetical protein
MDNDGFSSPQIKENPEKKQSLDFYDKLESQVQEFKTIYLPASLPAVAVNKLVFRLETPISDYVQDLAFYDIETFKELPSSEPPKNCQKILLVRKDIKNRKAEMAKLTEAVSKGKKLDVFSVTAGFGLNVRIDNSLKIKSFYYILPLTDKMDEKLLEFYITNYGYPKEVSIPQATKGYIWGLKYNDEKYFLILTKFSSPTTGKSSKNSDFSQIIAYRKDSSCKN